MQNNDITIDRELAEDLFLVVLQAKYERAYWGQSAKVLERIGDDLAERLCMKAAA